METYAPRATDATVLHGVMRDHLDDFLAAAAARTYGTGLPTFIYGSITEFSVERFGRDARLMTITEGTSEIQLTIIARELGL